MSAMQSADNNSFDNELTKSEINLFIQENSDLFLKRANLYIEHTDYNSATNDLEVFFKIDSSSLVVIEKIYELKKDKILLK